MDSGKELATWVNSKFAEDARFKGVSAAAVGLWFMCVSWAGAKGSFDVVIPRAELVEFGGLIDIAEELVEAGLLESVPGASGDFDGWKLKDIDGLVVRAAEPPED